jgi:hypothetical protein
LLASLVVSVQVVPHLLCLGGQSATQLGALQRFVAPVHVFPHAPQFVAVLIGVSQPFVGSVSQSAKPVAHPPGVGAHRPWASHVNADA